jgi:hypothetical protein
LVSRSVKIASTLDWVLIELHVSASVGLIFGCFGAKYHAGSDAHNCKSTIVRRAAPENKLKS